MMDSLQRKTYTTSHSLVYSYYISPLTHKTDPAKPTLLFLHGFPDTSHLFSKVVPHILALNYRFIIPDLLGCGESSKPIDPGLYASNKQNRDLVELLDYEKVTKIIPIGHDVGSWLAQRLYLFNSERCEALVLISVAYMPPNMEPFSEPISLEKFLALTEEMSGYPQYDYLRFFLSPEGPEIMRDHAESMYTLIYGAEKDAIRKYYCEKDAFKDYLLADKKLPVREFAKAPELKEAFISRVLKDGLDAPLCWYRSMIGNIQYDAEKHFKSEDVIIHDPVLFIGCSDDAVARTDAIEGPAALGLLPDLQVVELDCSHYCPLEKPNEVAKTIIDFLKNKNL